MLLFGYVYVYLFIPETRGLTLEEVRTSQHEYFKDAVIICLIG